MKYIVIDLYSAQPIGKTIYHGGGEYIKTIFRAFSDKYYNKANEMIIVCYETNKFLDDWILRTIKEKNFCIKNVCSLSEIINWVNEFAQNGDVRFFSGLPYHYDKFNFPQNVISIGTLHGLRSVEKQTDKYLLKYYRGKGLLKEIVKKILKKPLFEKYYSVYENTINNFDVIITDSIHSAYSIRINYPNIIKNKKIEVFYPITQKITSFCNQYDNEDKYIMLISADRWIKNSYRGLKAIDELFSKQYLSGYSVRVYGNAPKRIRDSIKNKEHFIFYEYVSSEELEKAYRKCDILFYPTLNEGFGNVPMEAMKYGKTCVVSSVCSLPEIYKDTVYWCNPYDVMEMENRIMQAVENKIDTRKIFDRLEQLYFRQNKDMDKLLDLIIGTK